MSELTIFLAQLFGVPFLILGLSLFINMDSYKKVIKDFDVRSPLGFFTSFAAMFIGMAIVLHHNLWTNPPEVIISLFGWLSILKGGVRLLMPEWSQSMIKRFVKAEGYYYFAGVFCLLLGGYLTYTGFFL